MYQASKIPVVAQSHKLKPFQFAKQTKKHSYGARQGFHGEEYDKNRPHINGKRKMELGPSQHIRRLFPGRCREYRSLS